MNKELLTFQSIFMLIIGISVIYRKDRLLKVPQWSIGLLTLLLLCWASYDMAKYIYSLVIQ
jgi:TctA family transporter